MEELKSGRQFSQEELQAIINTIELEGTLTYRTASMIRRGMPDTDVVDALGVDGLCMEAIEDITAWVAIVRRYTTMGTFTKEYVDQIRADVDYAENHLSLLCEMDIPNGIVTLDADTEMGFEEFHQYIGSSKAEVAVEVAEERVLPPEPELVRATLQDAVDKVCEDLGLTHRQISPYLSTMAFSTGGMRSHILIRIVEEPDDTGEVGLFVDDVIVHGDLTDEEEADIMDDVAGSIRECITPIEDDFHMVQEFKHKPLCKG